MFTGIETNLKIASKNKITFFISIYWDISELMVRVLEQVKCLCQVLESG